MKKEQMFQLALDAHIRNHEGKKAVELYKKLISTYPDTEEAKLAEQYLFNIEYGADETGTPKNIATNVSASRPSLIVQNVPSFIAAVGMSMAFFMPWMTIFGLGVTGSTLGKIGAEGQAAWVVLILASLSVVSHLVAPSRFINFLAGIAPFVLLFYFGHEMGTDIFQVLGIGAWLTLGCGMVLIFAPLGSGNVSPSMPRNIVSDYIGRPPRDQAKACHSTTSPREPSHSVQPAVPNGSVEPSTGVTVEPGLWLEKASEFMQRVVQAAPERLRHIQAMLPSQPNWPGLVGAVLAIALIGYLGLSLYATKQETNRLRLQSESQAVLMQQERDRLVSENAAQANFARQQSQGKAMAEQQAAIERQRREEAAAREMEARRRAEAEAAAKNQAQAQASLLRQAQDLESRRSREEQILTETKARGEIEAKSRYQSALGSADKQHAWEEKNGVTRYQAAITRAGGNPLRIAEVERAYHDYQKRTNEAHARMRANVESNYQRELAMTQRTYDLGVSRIEERYRSEAAIVRQRMPTDVGTTSTTKHEAKTESSGIVASPSIHVGDRYTYETVDFNDNSLNNVSTREIVDSANGIFTQRNVNIKSGHTRIIRYDGSWNILGSGTLVGDEANFQPALKYFEFPLQIGKTWEARSTETNPKSGVTRTHIIHARVEGQEKVTVPAGTFDTIKIVLKTETIGVDKRISGTDISWYAPAVRRTVRSELESLESDTGKTGKRVIQLLNYELR